MTTAGSNIQFAKKVKPIRVGLLELYPNSKCRDCKATGLLYCKVFGKRVPCRCLSVMAEDGRGTKINLQAVWGVYANQKLVRAQ